MNIVGFPLRVSNQACIELIRELARQRVFESIPLLLGVEAVVLGLVLRHDANIECFGNAFKNVSGIIASPPRKSRDHTVLIFIYVYVIHRIEEAALAFSIPMLQDAIRREPTIKEIRAWDSFKSRKSVDIVSLLYQRAAGRNRFVSYAKGIGGTAMHMGGAVWLACQPLGLPASRQNRWQLMNADRVTVDGMSVSVSRSSAGMPHCARTGSSAVSGGWEGEGVASPETTPQRRNTSVALGSSSRSAGNGSPSTSRAGRPFRSSKLRR